MGKIKHGARLMQHIKGEAEFLLETLSVEDIIKEVGDKAIFAMLDEKEGSFTFCNEELLL